MDNALTDFRNSRRLTRAEFGRLLGYAKSNPSRFVERIETGEIAADADMVERIERLTGGAVTPVDMHAVRLAWLRANRPERFAPCMSVEASS